jgi:predicted transcriptional regulator
MAEPASIFDSIDEDAEAKAIAEAEADIAAGRVVPHDKVVAWIKSWFTDKELPRPEPR